MSSRFRTQPGVEDYLSQFKASTATADQQSSEATGERAQAAFDSTTADKERNQQQEAAVAQAKAAQRQADAQRRAARAREDADQSLRANQIEQQRLTIEPDYKAASDTHARAKAARDKFADDQIEQQGTFWVRKDAKTGGITPLTPQEAQSRKDARRDAENAFAEEDRKFQPVNQQWEAIQAARRKAEFDRLKLAEARLKEKAGLADDPQSPTAAVTPENLPAPTNATEARMRQYADQQQGRMNTYADQQGRRRTVSPLTANLIRIEMQKRAAEARAKLGDLAPEEAAAKVEAATQRQAALTEQAKEQARASLTAKLQGQDPATAAPTKPAPREALSKALQDSNLFGSATSAMGGAVDKNIRRKADGDWDLPIMAPQSKNPVVNAIRGVAVDTLGQKTGARLDSAGLAVDKKAIQAVFHKFQQDNNLSDEEVQAAWSDLGNQSREFDKKETARVLSDGSILPNYRNSDWLDPAKAEAMIATAPAPETAKANARANLQAIQDTIAGSKIEAYAAASAGVKGYAETVNPAFGSAVGKAVAIQSPDEWARANNRMEDFGTPKFVRDYEREVADKAGWTSGLAVDTVQGDIKLANTLAGFAGVLGSEAAGRAGASLSEASSLMAEGQKDTGLIGSVIEEAPSIFTQIALTRGMGATASALGAGERAQMLVGTIGALATAGGQSAGATYSAQIAAGDTVEEARKKAIRSGVSTAVITGIFQKIGAGGVEKVAAGRSAGDITMRDLLGSASRKELVSNTRRFAGQIVKSVAGEGAEEGIDELTQAFLTADPDTNLADAWDNAVEAAKVGGFLGGFVETGAKLTAGTTPEQRHLQQIASIERRIQTDAVNPDLVADAIAEIDPTEKVPTAEELKEARQLVAPDADALRTHQKQAEAYKAAVAAKDWKGARAIDEAMQAAFPDTETNTVRDTADAVLLVRELGEQDVVTKEAFDQAQQAFNEAMVSGDREAKAVVGPELAAARSARQAHLQTRAAVKIASGMDVSALTDAETRAMGWKSDNAGGIEPMTPKELADNGLQAPLMRPAADGSPILTDDVVATVRATSERAGRRVKLGEQEAAALAQARFDAANTPPTPATNEQNQQGTPGPQDPPTTPQPTPANQNAPGGVVRDGTRQPAPANANADGPAAPPEETQVDPFEPTAEDEAALLAELELEMAAEDAQSPANDAQPEPEAPAPAPTPEPTRATPESIRSAKQVQANIEAAVPRLKGKVTTMDGDRPSGGVWIGLDGRMTISPRDIAGEMQRNGWDEATATRILTDLAVSHEVAHIAQVDALRARWKEEKPGMSFETYFLKFYGEQYQEMGGKGGKIDIEAANIYDPTAGNPQWQSLSPGQKGAEIFRMFLENKLTGTTSELSREIERQGPTKGFIQLIKDAIAYLKGVIDTLPDQAKAHLAELEAFYKELTTDLSPASTSDTPPKPEEAIAPDAGEPPSTPAKRQIDSPARREAFRLLRSGELIIIDKIHGGKVQAPPAGMLKIIKTALASGKATQKQRDMWDFWQNAGFNGYLAKNAFGTDFNGKVAQELHGMLFTQDRSNTALDDWAGLLGDRMTNDEAMLEVMGELTRISKGLTTENDARNPNKEAADPEEIAAAETEIKAGKKEVTTQAKQDKAFDAAQASPSDAAIGMEAADFSKDMIGGTITVDGEPMTIADVETDSMGITTAVILQDGKRFGRQVLEDGEVVFVEEDAPEIEAETSTPVEETPSPVEEIAPTPELENAEDIPEFLQRKNDPAKAGKPAPVPRGNEMGGWQTRNANLGEAFKNAKKVVDGIEDRIETARRKDAVTLPKGFNTYPYANAEGMVVLEDSDGNDIRYPLTIEEAAREAWQLAGGNQFAESEAVAKRTASKLAEARRVMAEAGAAWNGNGPSPIKPEPEAKKSRPKQKPATDKESLTVQKPAPPSAMDKKNTNAKELFADDGGFKLGQEATTDGAKVEAARKAKEEAKAAADAAQRDMFAPQDSPALTPEEQALKDALEGLFASRSRDTGTPDMFAPENLAKPSMREVKTPGNKSALGAYRALTAKKQAGKTLKPEEEQDLLEAETALGQKMAFDMAPDNLKGRDTDLLKAAIVEATMPQATRSMRAIQQSMFMGEEGKGGQQSLFSSASPAPPFYSQLARVIEAKIPAKASPEQIMGTILNPSSGVKAEEIKWSGIKQAAEQMARENGGKVPKDALLAYLADEGAVKFEEVTANDNDDVPMSAWSPRQDEILREKAEAIADESGKSVEDELYALTRDPSELREAADQAREEWREANPTAPTKFSQYTLPGGENYREVVLAMPDASPANVAPSAAVQAKYADEWKAIIKEHGGFSEQADALHDKMVKETVASRVQNYTSSHFPDVPNYVAHMRVDERTLPDGKRTMHAAEYQSDRHQAGRKQGYRDESFDVKNLALDSDGVPTEWQFKPTNTVGQKGREWDVYTKDGVRVLGGMGSEKEAREIAAKHVANRNISDPRIADAPFRTTWPLALFKRHLRDAVAGGFDSVSWDAGDTQAERFSLSTHVKNLRADKNPDGSWFLIVEPHQGSQTTVDVATDQLLADQIGKEMAEKVIADGGGTYTGLDLKVGGTGMKGFYDNMLPKEIGKYVKQWGGKVEKVNSGVFQEEDHPSWKERGGNNRVPIWRIDITAAMRAGVESGQALFSSASPNPDFQNLRRSITTELTKAPSQYQYEPAQETRTDIAALLEKSGLQRVVPTNLRLDTDQLEKVSGAQIVFVREQKPIGLVSANTLSVPRVIIINADTSAASVGYLIAHEMTHVAQKVSAAPSGPIIKRITELASREEITAMFKTLLFKGYDNNKTLITAEIHAHLVADAVAGTNTLGLQELVNREQLTSELVAYFDSLPRLNPDAREGQLFAEAEERPPSGETLRSSASRNDQSPYSAPIPPAVIAKMWGSLTALVETGQVTTPETLAATLKKFGPGAPKLSQGLWSIISAVKGEAPTAPDWAGIYGDSVQTSSNDSNTADSTLAGKGRGNPDGNRSDDGNGNRETLPGMLPGIEGGRDKADRASQSSGSVLPPQSREVPPVATDTAETYAKSVKRNLEHMGTKGEEWSVVPFTGREIENPEGGRPMIEQDYSSVQGEGWKQAPTLYPGNPQSPCCGWCGKAPVKYLFGIKNDSKKWSMMVGSECITHFSEKSGDAQSQDAKASFNRAAWQSLDDSLKEIKKELSTTTSDSYYRYTTTWSSKVASDLYEQGTKLRGKLSQKDSTDGAFTSWQRKNGQAVEDLVTKIRDELQADDAKQYRVRKRQAFIRNLENEIANGKSSYGRRYPLSEADIERNTRQIEDHKKQIAEITEPVAVATVDQAPAPAKDPEHVTSESLRALYKKHGPDITARYEKLVAEFGEATVVKTAQQLGRDYVRGSGGMKIIPIISDLEGNRGLMRDYPAKTAPAAKESLTTETPEPGTPDFKLTPPPEKSGIQDFGEKILGARKDLWGKFKHALEQELPSDAADITISKYFPEPDYETAMQNGVSVDALATYKALRDSIPAKPKRSYKLTRWAEMVRGIHPFMQKLASGSELTAQENAALAKMFERNEELANAINFYKDLGFPAFTKAADWKILDQVSEFYSGGVKLAKPIMKTAAVFKGRFVDGMESTQPERKGYIEVLDKVRAHILSEIESPAVAQAKPIDFNIWHDRITGDIFIGKKAVNGVVRLKTGFKDSKEARQYLADNRAALEDQWNGLKKPVDYRKQVNAPRQGPERRPGDVTPEMFQDAFGFRGVQFGNWVEGERRQVDINEAFDAFMDLADALGIPPKAVSLDGSLGLAFGARGIPNAKAHYEPGQVVINLTKKTGPGSLGHEWFHGFDNYFARLDKTGETRAQSLDKFATQYSPAPKNMRPEVWEAFKRIRLALDSGPFAERSKQLDQTKSKPYYSQIIEKAARAFERYTVDRLKGMEISNDFLVNLTKDESPALPTQAEMNAGIRQAFDNLFNILDTKETDKGTALFSSQSAVLSKSKFTRRLKAIDAAYESGDFETAERLDAQFEEDIEAMDARSEGMDEADPAENELNDGVDNEDGLRQDPYAQLLVYAIDHRSGRIDTGSQSLGEWVIANQWLANERISPSVTPEQVEAAAAELLSDYERRRDRALSLFSSASPGGRKSDPILDKIKAMVADPDKKADTYGRMNNMVGDVRRRFDNARLKREFSEQGVDAARYTMIRDVAILEAIVKSLPKEMRGKFVGKFRDVAELKTEKGRENYMLKMLPKVEKELEIYLQKLYRQDIRKVIDKSRPKPNASRNLRGKIGASGHAIVKQAVNAMTLNVDTEKQLEIAADALANVITETTSDEVKDIAETALDRIRRAKGTEAKLEIANEALRELESTEDDANIAAIVSQATNAMILDTNEALTLAAAHREKIEVGTKRVGDEDVPLTLDEWEELEGKAVALELFSDYENASSARLAKALEFLTGVYSESREQWLEVLKERKAQKEDDIETLRETIKAPEFITNEMLAAAKKKSEKIVHRFGTAMLEWISSYEQILGQLKENTEDPKAIAWVDEQVAKLRDARGAYDDKLEGERVALEEAMANIFGTGTGWTDKFKLDPILHDLSTRKENHGVTVLEGVSKDTIPVPVKLAESLVRKEINTYTHNGVKYEIVAQDMVALEEAWERFQELPDEAQGRKPLIYFTRVKSQGKRNTIGAYSQLEMLKEWLAMRQADLAKKYESRGWDQTTMDEMEAALLPEVKRLGLWLVDRLESQRSELDAKHRGEYGIGLDLVDNYFPALFENAQSQESNLGPDGVDTNVAAKTASSLKGRVAHSARARQMNALSVFLSNRAQVHYFMTHATPLREMVSMFRATKSNESLRVTLGENYTRNLGRELKLIETNGMLNADGVLEAEKMMRKVQSGFALSILGLNIGTIMINTTAMLNTLLGVPAKELLSGLSPEYAGDVKRFFDSPAIQRRLKHGTSHEIRIAAQGGIGSNPLAAGGRRVAQTSMQAINWWDTYSNSILGALAYRATLVKSREAGMSEAAAVAAAEKQIDRLSATVMQPNNMLSRSLGEVKLSQNPIGGLLFMFATEPRKNFAIGMYAARKLITGKGAVSKGMAAQQLIVLGSFYSAFGYLIRSLIMAAIKAGDDEPEEFWERMIARLTDAKGWTNALATEHLKGFPLVGEAASRLITGVINETEFIKGERIKQFDTSNNILNRGVAGVFKASELAGKDLSPEQQVKVTTQAIQATLGMFPETAFLSQTGNVARDGLGLLTSNGMEFSTEEKVRRMKARFSAFRKTLPEATDANGKINKMVQMQRDMATAEYLSREMAKLDPEQRKAFIKAVDKKRNDAVRMMLGE